MIFRDAKLEDSDQLDNLLTKLIEDERENYDKDLEVVVVKDFYKNCILKEGHKIFLCEDDDKIVGYVYLIIDNRRHGKVDALFVEKDYRNKGIASKLFEKGISWFKENNIKKIEVNVLSENIEAKKIYNKLGFNTFKETMVLDL